MQQRQKSTRVYQVPHTEPLQQPVGTGARKTTYSIRPVQLFCGAFACIAVTLLASGGTGYFLFKNDFLKKDTNNRDELVLEYQDHIDRLRTKIETLTSRQMVDRESVEIQVMDVLRRQKDLDERHALVADLVARAESVGIYLAGDKPVPPQKPSLASLGLPGASTADDATAIGGESELIAEPVKALGLRDGATRSVDPLKILQQTAEEQPATNAREAQKKTLNAAKH